MPSLHARGTWRRRSNRSSPALPARGRWPHLVVDGVHLHVGSQIDSAEPLLATALAALALVAESARRGAPLASVNLGGGFGVDYTGDSDRLDLPGYAAAIHAL